MTKSEQARADALADAETLNRFQDVFLTWAEYFGSFAAAQARQGVPTGSYEDAKAAARAAFRAVPGLRGE